MADLSPAGARLKAFLENPDVPDDDKREAVRLYRASGNGPSVEGQGDAGWMPTITRLAGGAGGAILGGVLSGGNPLGALAGGIAGSALGDVGAQMEEMSAGARESYNPGRTIAEAGIGALPGSSFTAPLKSAVLRGALAGTISTTVTSLSEGQGIPPVGEMAMGALFGGGLGGLVHLGGRLAGAGRPSTIVGRQAATELMGNPIAASQLEDAVNGVVHMSDSPSTIEGIAEAHKMALQLPLFTQTEFPLWRKTSPSWPNPPERADWKPKAYAEGKSKITGKYASWPKDQLTLMEAKANPRDIVDGSMRQGDLFADEPMSYKKMKVLTPREEDAYVNATVDDELHHTPLPPGPPDSGVPPGGNGKKFAEVDPWTAHIWQWIQPRKFTFMSLQEATGYPVGEDYYRLSQKHKQMVAYTSEQQVELKKTFRGIPTAKRTAYMEWLVDPDNRDRVELARGFTKADKLKVGELEKVADRLLQPHDLSADEFFREVVPAWRQGAYAPRDPMTGTGGYTGESPLLSGKLRGLTDYVANGEIGIGEPDSLLFFTKLVRASAFRKYLGDDWGEMYLKYSDKSIPDDVKQPMISYLNVMRGQPDIWAKRVSNMLNTILAASDPAMGKIGHAPLRTDVNTFVSDVMASMYAGTMGFRPAPIIRNSFQPVQTALPLMGVRWLGEGIRQAMTKEGKAIAAQAGIGQGIHQLAELESASRSAVGRVIQGIAQKGLGGFEGVEQKVRRVVYLGTRAKALNAARVADEISDPMQKLAMFIDKADIDRYEPVERKIIGDMYVKGDVEGAAHAAATMMVDNTQFMYALPDRPPMLSGIAGRTLGAFGNWPLSYAAYLRRLTPGLGEGPTRKVVRDAARFAGVNAMLVGAFAGIGRSMGDEDSIRHNLGWTFLSPMFYTGGPILEAGIAGGKALGSLAQGEIWQSERTGKLAMSQNLREGVKALETFIPGAGMVHDIRKALGEDTPQGALGRITGFKRGK